MKIDRAVIELHLNTLCAIGKPDVILCAGWDSSGIQTPHTALVKSVDTEAGIEEVYEFAERYTRMFAGVYVSINEFSGDVRKKEFCTRVRCIALDCDKGWPKRWAIEPNMIVESKRGPQAYWLLDEIVTIEEAAKITESMVQIHDADKGAKDAARVLRLAGTYHQKDKDDPWLCKLTLCERRYTPLSELRAVVMPEPKAGRGRSAERQLKECCEDLAKAQSGERHPKLCSVAYRWGGHVAAGSIEANKVVDALVDAAVTHGHDRDEATRVVLDCMEAGSKKPIGIGGGKGQSRKVNIVDIASKIIDSNHMYCENGDVYWYERGYYRKLSPDEIRARIGQFVVREASMEWKARLCTEVIEYIQTCKIITPEQLRKRRESRLINCRNCLLNPDTLETQTHTPDELGFRQIDTDWKETEPGPEDQMLTAALPDESDRKVLLEFFGSCLAPQDNWQKCLFMTGGGSNGKSSIIEIWRAVLGAENHSRVPLRKFSDRFDVYDLSGKLANINEESETAGVLDTATLKEFIGGFSIRAERKYRDAETVETTAKLIFAVNRLPQTGDSSHGYYRRILQVNFGTEFTETFSFRRFIDMHTGEANKSRWLHMAVDGLRRLRTADRFTVNEDTQQLSSLRYDQDSVLAFWSECIVYTRNEEDTALKSDIYDLYKMFCEARSMDCLPQSKFWSAIRLMPSKYRETRPEVGGKKTPGRMKDVVIPEGMKMRLHNEIIEKNGESERKYF